MKFKTAERFNLLNILPEIGNFATLKILRDLREKLSLTEEENKKWKVAFINDGKRSPFYTWNNEGEKANTEIKIGEKANDIIVEALKDLEKNNILPDTLFEVYEKIVVKK